MKKSTGHDQNLISSEGGQDKSACKMKVVRIHQHAKFQAIPSMHSPETYPDGRLDGQAEKWSPLVRWTNVTMYRWRQVILGFGWTDGWMDGRTDGQPKNIMPLAPKGGGIKMMWCNEIGSWNKKNNKCNLDFWLNNVFMRILLRSQTSNHWPKMPPDITVDLTKSSDSSFVFLEFTNHYHTMDMLWEKFHCILPLYMKPINFQSKASVVCSVTTALFIDFCLKKLNVFCQHIGT